MAKQVLTAEKDNDGLCTFTKEETSATRAKNLINEVIVEAKRDVDGVCKLSLKDSASITATADLGGTITLYLNRVAASGDDAPEVIISKGRAIAIVHAQYDKDLELTEVDLRGPDNGAQTFSIDSVEMIETYGPDADWALYENGTNCVYYMRCSQNMTFVNNCVKFS